MGERLMVKMTNQSKKLSNQNGKKQMSTYSIVISVMSAVVVLGASWSLFQTLGKQQAAMERLDQAQAVNRQAVENNRQAQQEFQRVQDSEYLAQIARRDYYYSKEGEIIFDLKEEDQEEVSESQQ